MIYLIVSYCRISSSSVRLFRCGEISRSCYDANVGENAKIMLGDGWEFSSLAFEDFFQMVCNLLIPIPKFSSFDSFKSIGWWLGCEGAACRWLQFLLRENENTAIIEKQQHQTSRNRLHRIRLNSSHLLLKDKTQMVRLHHFGFPRNGRFAAATSTFRTWEFRSWSWNTHHGGDQ